jgi:hypothetical protein
MHDDDVSMAHNLWTPARSEDLDLSKARLPTNAPWSAHVSAWLLWLRPWRLQGQQQHRGSTSSSSSSVSSSVSTSSRRLIPDMRATRTVYGILVDSYIYLPEDENRDVYQECFKGMELKSCQHCGTQMLRNSDGTFDCVPEDSVLGAATNDPELIQQPFSASVYDQADFDPPADTGDIDYRRNQQPYCLHCCSMSNPEPGYDVAETWNLYCPIDGIDRPGGLLPYTDFDNYQFRFARRDGLSDIEVVSCDLLRTPEQNDLVLQGYELNVWVVDYYQGVDYWRGVSKCEAKFIFEPVWDQDSCLDTFNAEFLRPECACPAGVSPCVFREQITMLREESNSLTNFAAILLAFGLAFCGCLCGLGAYYTGRCGNWCDVTGGVDWLSCK